MNWDYIAGLFDGEGSLCVGIHGRRQGFCGFGFYHHIAIGLSAWDTSVLYEIRDFLLEQGIRCTAHRYKINQEGRLPHRDVLTIGSFDSLIRFCEIIGNKVFVRKENVSQCLKVLRRMKEINATGTWYTKEELLEIAKMIEQLPEVSRRRRRWSYKRLAEYLERQNKKSRGHRWTDQEEEFIIKNYPTMTRVELGHKLGVSKDVIWYKVQELRKMGLLGHKTPWTEETDKFLLDNYLNMPAKVLAEKIGVSDKALIGHVFRLRKQGKIGLKYKLMSKAEKIRKVKKENPSLSPKEIAELTGTTPTYVSEIIYHMRLGIKHSRYIPKTQSKKREKASGVTACL